MTDTSSASIRKPLRLWPGVTAAAVLLLIRFILPAVRPDAEIFGESLSTIGILGGLFLSVVVFLWWLFFSRAPWLERLAVLALAVVAVVATRPLMHISIQNGMMGMMYFIYATPPTLALALVGWAALTRGCANRTRYAALLAAMLLGCGVWGLARTNGLFGGSADLEWRWTPTAEERLLAQTAAEPVVPPVVAAPAPPPAGPAPAAPAVATAPAAAPVEAPPLKPEPAPAAMTIDWQGFRGPERNDVVAGTAINTDWTASPPVELWRRPIGPGWSSFAVGGGRIYTQEQRGDDEIIACYDEATGMPVWMHRDPVRFWESNGGAGPRATPTLAGGRVYALGATGVLNALDATTGRIVWTRNASVDTGVKVPGWGFAGSPIVVDDVVIAAVSGALAAYDRASGAPRWSKKSGGGSYSSPHPITIDGVPQVLLLNGAGVTSVSPSDGSLLWQNAWQGVPMVQPAQIAGGDILITTADAMGGAGVRRLAVSRDGTGWKVEERWTSRSLKPYFNDYVVHDGYAYGFDGSILACVDLSDGSRKWKGGRYGQGQMLLLRDNDVLLVMSEEGELALVRATPDQFTELARFKALDAKTWNHPVLVGDTLFVRNGEEMAAFRLAKP